MNNSKNVEKPLRILYIEGSARDAGIIRERLIDAGFLLQMDWASNGQQFTTFLQSSTYDLVLADYQLPGFDAPEALRLTKLLQPGTPFICVSGAIGEEAAVELLKLGAVDYVIKDRLGRLPFAIKRAIDEALINEERRQAEEELRHSKKKYLTLSNEFQALLDAIPDSITLQSPDLNVLWANKRSVSEINKEPDQVIGLHCYKMLFNRKKPCEVCPVERSLRTGEQAEIINTLPDGRVWELRAIPVKEDERVVKVIEVGRDITEHRRLEEQLRHSQKMESIGTMAGGIAHDFNNILTAIIGYLEIVLMKMAKDDPQRRHLEQVRLAADRAAHLTKDLLLFSRKQKSELNRVDLNETVKKVDTFLKRVIREDIACKTDLRQEPILVLGDIYQLEQVIINLAINARDAMPEGGVITVSTDRIELDQDFIESHGYGKPGPYACLIVSDTGRGMNEETRQHIFEPFFTTKEIGKGTGLGLAVVYGIIKQHNGYILVNSESGKGTTFQIYLPLIVTEAVENPRIPRGEVPLSGTETILLAEDNDLVRNLSRTVLENFGYTVITSIDGVEALNKFTKNKGAIDLLLFDLFMPNMNGKETYDEIRKIQPDIKAIFTSGYAPDTVQEKAIQEGGVPLILKPATPIELLKYVRRVLDGGESGQD